VIWLGLGLAVLVNSRPLEGILMAIPVGCLVLPWKIKWERTRNFHFVKKVILPFVLILSIIVIGVGSYNKAITGKASRFPYVLCLKNQMTIPLFIWEPLRPGASLRFPATSYFMRDDSARYYLEKRTWKGFFTDEFKDIRRIFIFYFGYVLAAPVLFFLPGFLRNKQRAFKSFLVVLILACTCAAMPSMALWHYFSPVTDLVVLLVVWGLRTLACFLKHKAIKLVYVLIAIQVMSNMVIFVKSDRVESYGTPAQGQGFALEQYTRQQLINVLMQKGGKHLVIVDRDPGLLCEWVYNGADIDKQPIVWARSINHEEDAQVVAYFKDRRVWRIKVGH